MSTFASALGRASFESLLVAQGVPSDKAQREADKRYPQTPAEVRAIERDARISEKAEQAEVTKRFRVCGFRVRNLSQPRATKQSPGFPDLWITGHGVGLWFETKRQKGGKFSPAQAEFRDDCRSNGVRWASGDRYDAENWLVLRGFATMGSDGQITPLREK